MRTAGRAEAFPQFCRVCKLDRPGVDFDAEDQAGWVYICSVCLGEASKLLGDGVPKDEHARVVEQLNEVNRELTRTVGDRETAQLELAKVAPEVGRLREQVEELTQTRVALQATVAEQAAEIRDYQHGRVHEQAREQFVATRNTEPLATTSARKRKAT